MKFGNILICLAGGLALNANLRADDVVLPGNPYAPVVTRNIFGLNPPTPFDPTIDATPPPKITPNGIMSIFGQLQVLFKVASTGKPGKPAGDDSYILSEGQRQDDIEIVKINEKVGSVTFNNHGTVQELALVNGTASSGSVAGANPATGFQTMPGGGTRFGNNFGSRGGGNFNGTYGGRNLGNGNNGGNNSGGMGNGPMLGNASTLTRPGYHEDGPPMDPVVQAAMMTAQREQLKNSGEPIYKLLPDPMAQDDSGPNANP